MTNTNKELSLCHINTRSILAYNNESKSNQDKMDEIRQILCKQYEYSVIAVTETWLTSNTLSDDADLRVENYTFYRKDRNNGNSRGGGVGFFITDNLNCNVRLDLSPNNAELLWLEIKTDQKRILVGVCYRPPGQSRDDQNSFFLSLENSLESVKLTRPDIVLLLGDFNDRCIDWNMPHAQSEIGDKLSNIVSQSNLYQIINEPTRYFSNQPAILDLIITDSPHLILSSGVSPPIANLDHCTVYCKLNVQTYRAKSYTRTVWDYKTANIGALNESINAAPWYIPYTLFEDLDDIVNFNNSIIISTCKENIRCKNVTIRTKDRPWMCNEVRLFLRKRDRLFKRYKRTLSAQDKFNFYLARREANRAIRNAKKRYQTKVVDSLSDPNLNIRNFWKISKRILDEKSERTIPPLLENDNLIAEDDKKADIFNNYFASIASLDHSEPLPKLPDFQFLTDARMHNIQTSEVEVQRLLSLLNVHKSTGPDAIGNWVLKHCSTSLCKPLTAVFNKSLCDGIFPSVWKQANVCPVFKKGNKSDKTNYRPISLLSNTSKILEKIVYKRLYEFLTDNNLLTEQNSGFKKNDSTINQLLKIVHQIYQDINDGKDTCMVFLDVSKAFDKVWHEGLLFKIRQMGITGSLFDWLKSYISARCQKVVLNGMESNLCFLESGVPQGSILGPLLFLIFINDIVDEMECNINLFADDTSVQQRITDITSFNKVNRDLQRLTGFGKQWLVIFNAIKTEYIIISRKRNRLNHPDLFLNGDVLTEVDQHIHLGVTISNTLSWSFHINAAIAKADRRLSVIRRCQNILPRSCKEMLYKTTIRPVLDYGDIIYDPCLKSESEAIEKFQRKAALVCTGAFRITSNERLLNELGLEKMETRRKVHRQTLFYKIVKSLSPPYLRQICNLIPHNTDAYNLRRNNSLLVPFIRKEIFSKSFFPKTIREWNNLSTETKESDSVKSFKNKLKNIYGPNEANKLYVYGHGRSTTNHCRMRLGLSHLRSHLYNYNLINTPFCENEVCDHVVETPSHYLLNCPKYAEERHVMLSEISEIVFPGINHNTIVNLMPDYLCGVLLQGSETLSLDTNKEIFSHVFKFIDESGRFNLNDDTVAHT